MLVADSRGQRTTLRCMHEVGSTGWFGYPQTSCESSSVVGGAVLQAVVRVLPLLHTWRTPVSCCTCLFI